MSPRSPQKFFSVVGAGIALAIMVATPNPAAAGSLYECGSGTAVPVCPSFVRVIDRASGSVAYQCGAGTAVPTCPSFVRVTERPTPPPVAPALSPEERAALRALRAKQHDTWRFGAGVGALSVDGIFGLATASVGYHWDLAVPLEFHIGFGGLTGENSADPLGVYSLRAGVAPGFGTKVFALFGGLEYLGAGGSDGPKQMSLAGVRIEPRFAVGPVDLAAFATLGHSEAALFGRTPLDGFGWSAGLGIGFRR